MFENAICKDCGQKMDVGNSCTIEHIKLNGKVYERIPYGVEGFYGEVCHDCNVKIGQIHHFGCDVEQCPRCGGQLISCSCGESSE